MLASIRHSAARVSLRRTVNIRTLASSAAPDAAREAGPDASEDPIFSALDTTGPQAVASSSHLTPISQPPISTANIRVPPAEDPLLHLFTSLVMKDGRRHEALRATSQMLLHLHAFTQQEPLPLLREAVTRAAPLLRCQQFKRAAKQFVFPTPLNERQRAHKALQWILEASKKKGGKNMPERVAREIIGVLNGKSVALDQKEMVHKLAVLHRGNVLRPPRV
ncbi:ribosomal protein S7 [Trametes versicolor FP-101664 SS1]|uniref:Ribosomal protein S7 n=1 Tax=Trametes versicolor (strain FP-101664) TaxID=717944 RepID=R7S9N2_TRAVS|nr:ribosomal protein S7 [Trametes versicolor FP-101664 SS1]EIW51639.1 ribosomal protein S7 [Trametes versicolor FP-101664 SS1]